MTERSLPRKFAPKTIIAIAVALIAVVALAWLVLPAPPNQIPPAPTNTAALTEQSTATPISTLQVGDPARVVSPEEWLKNGPKEPLVPPTIHATAEPVPDSIVTAEPLVPPVIHIDPQPVVGPKPTSEPLTPPVISAGATAAPAP